MKIVNISNIWFVVMLVIGLWIVWNVATVQPISGQYVIGASDCNACLGLPASSKCKSRNQGTCPVTRMSCNKDPEGTGVCDSCSGVPSCYPCRNQLYCENQANEVCYD